MGTVKSCKNGIVSKSIEFCFSKECIPEAFIYKIKVCEFIGKTETNLSDEANERVRGTSPYEVKSKEDAMDFIWSAISSRKIGDNGVNSCSSRTNLVIQLMRFAKNTSNGGLTGEPLKTCFFLTEDPFEYS
jgi:hypothetical protein